MKHETREKILEDIEYILKELFKELQRKNYLERILRLALEGHPNVRELSRRMYDHYIRDRSYQKAFIDIASLEKNPEFTFHIDRAGRALQHFYNEAVALCEAAYAHRKLLVKPYEINDAFNVFSYAQKPPTNATFRFYINAHPRHLDRAVEYLLHLFEHYSRHGLAPLSQFKFFNPHKNPLQTLLRADKIVLYCYSGTVLQYFFRDLPTIAHKNWTNDDIPRTTREIATGIGFAPGLQQHHQNYYQQFVQEKASYGQFVCLVISQRLCDWITHHRQLPSPNNYREIAERSIYQLLNEHFFEFEPES
jgi:hypothetical protein